MGCTIFFIIVYSKYRTTRVLFASTYKAKQMKTIYYSLSNKRLHFPHLFLSLINEPLKYGWAGKSPWTCVNSQFNISYIRCFASYMFRSTWNTRHFACPQQITKFVFQSNKLFKKGFLAFSVIKLANKCLTDSFTCDLNLVQFLNKEISLILYFSNLL